MGRSLALENKQRMLEGHRPKSVPLPPGRSLALERKARILGQPVHKTPDKPDWTLTFSNKLVYAKDLRKRVEQLDDYRRTIKQTMDNDKKNGIKQEFVESFREYVQNYLASAATWKNPIVSWYCIYLGDCTYCDQGDYVSEFIETTLLAIKRDQATPDVFDSSLPVFLYDMIKEWTITEMYKHSTPRPFFDQLYDRLDQSRIPSQLKSRFHKLQGKIVLDFDEYESESDRLEDAIAAFEAAEADYNKAGVKTIKEKCFKELAKLKEGAGSEGLTRGQPGDDPEDDSSIDSSVSSEASDQVDSGDDIEGVD